MPPISSNGPDLQQLHVVIAAKPMRSTVAAMTPIRIARLRCVGGQARRRKADDDGVVAGQHEVDRNDLIARRSGRRP